MRKNVLISLLAVTGAPVAALANADVVIDQNVWKGDGLTVSPAGEVTVSTGKEVSIKKALAPGKYMLRATVVDNAKIVAVYDGKEYALDAPFTIEGNDIKEVTVKATAVTPGAFKFSDVKFELVFDFDNVPAILDLETQLSTIINSTSAAFKADPAWNDDKTGLKLIGSGLADQIKAIKTGGYDAYVKNHLWMGKNSTELKALGESITAFGNDVNNAAAYVDAYAAATAAYATAKTDYQNLTDNEWKTATDYTKKLYQKAYDDLGKEIEKFNEDAKAAYDAKKVTSKEVRDAFTKSVNDQITALKENIAKANGDNASWTNIDAAYQAALAVFNAATAEINDKMAADGNYADWNTEALSKIQGAWKQISDAYKAIAADKTQAAAKETEVLKLIQDQQEVITDTQTAYVNDYTTAEANKAAADAKIKTLEDNFKTAKNNPDVQKDFAKEIAEIDKAITALKSQVAKDYAAPHNILTATYDTDVNAIQGKIDALKTKAADVIENYDIYQELVANLGGETGLMKNLNDAKKVVADLKPAAKEDTYDAAAKFKATADNLKTVIEKINADVKKAYDERKLNSTTRVDLDKRIADTSAAITQYETDAKAAMARFDVVSAALKDYNAKLKTLKETVGVNTSVTKTPSTTVEGATYGECITNLEKKITKIEGDFTAAKGKLDAEHLAALLAISLDASISNDAEALNAQFKADKDKSEADAKVNAAKILYNAANEFIGSIQTRIDNHNTKDWKAGNEDGELGLKYTDLISRLAAIETELADQKAKITTVAANADAITADKAVEAMALLNVIKDDVNKINDNLVKLEGEADAQIALVKAENAAAKAVETAAKNVETTLDAAKKAFKVTGENIDTQAGEIQAKVDAVRTDAAAERAKEKIQEARKDSKDADGNVVKGLDSRLAELQKAANELETLAKDSTANFDAYEALKKVYTTQKVKLDNKNYTGYTDIFAKVKDLIIANTKDENQKYYLGLIQNTDPKGKYFKESEDILKAIEDAYTAGTAIEQTKEITARIKALTAAVKELPTLATNDFKANADMVKEGDAVMTLWNEVNTKYNGSDIAYETLKPLLDELAKIQKEIKDEQQLVKDSYAKGESAKQKNDVMKKYSEIRDELKKKEAFINGGDEYNSVIAGDNLNRYNAFLAAAKKAEEQYTAGRDMIKKYQSVSTEELRALVNVATIIDAQENIYKYFNLIEDLRNEAKSTYDATTSPELWDVKGTYAGTANDYTSELIKAKNALDKAVNDLVRAELDKKLSNLNDNQLTPAKAEIAAYDKNVQKTAFKDVVDFYDKLNATSYRNDPFLINNLDSDWKTFDEIEAMLGADLEQAAKDEWKAMYEGKYVGAAGTLTEKDDRYAGAKNDNEKWLKALKDYAYDGAADDLKAYEKKTKETLDKAVEAADKALKENNMFENIETVRGFIDKFYAEAAPVYKAAKDKADKYADNVKAYGELTADYNTLTAKIDAAKKYYEAFNIANSAIEADIEAAYNIVKGWQADLTQQNASAELVNRINGNTIAKDKKWYDYDPITSGNIYNIYVASNSSEVAGIRAEIQSIKEEKNDAVKKFYGSNTEMIKTIEKYYDDNCKNLDKELDDLLKAFLDNATDETAKQDAGLLALEKKVAKAHSGLTNLWKKDLIADVLANMNQIVADAEEDYTAAYAAFGKTHKPVQKDNEEAFTACRDRLDNIKSQIETYGDDIITYDDKVIHVVENIVKDIKAARAKVEAEDVPYIASEKALGKLKTATDELVAEYNRVKTVVDAYQHLTMVYDITSSGKELKYSDYYNSLYSDVDADVEAANAKIGEAENLLENGPATGLLTETEVDNIVNDFKYWNLYSAEVWGAYHETMLVYRLNVANAYNAMTNAFYSADSKVYDEKGELKDAYRALVNRYDAFMNYTSSFSHSIDVLTPEKDINGNEWLDENGKPVTSTPSFIYAWNEKLGVKLVAPTTDALVEEMNALTASAAENQYVSGDLTGDREVLGDDYIAILNAALNPESIEGKTFAAADVNGDGKLTIADVTLIASKITNGAFPTMGGVTPAPMSSAETMSVSAEDMNGVQRIAINLNNHKEYVGCQMDIVLPAGMTIVGESVGNRANGHNVYSMDVNGVHRVIVSTIENNSFLGGDAILYLDVTGGSVDKIALDNIIFAEANGRATTIEGNGATGIDGVEAESGLKQKIYSVGGQLLNKVKQGINIIRNANGKSQKVAK